jgi:hypothetical protein
MRFIERITGAGQRFLEAAKRCPESAPINQVVSG